MENRTKINAESGKQDLHIIREFELPVDLLFKAHEDPEIIEQWMGTHVLKLEGKKHGSWQYQTKNQEGKVMFQANGAIHEWIPNEKITRTFEMENMPFGVTLELITFEKLTDDTSRLHIHVIYESGDKRDQNLKMGMVQGINMAHDQLQTVAGKLK
ncbi:uncharacterized protein YndB with AHSA1/START domain [Chitinophaga dinghuensis]|uniref:Uncharacterized protein YndB with AHSA1/START domain n=1 Tax=Chitinophaga dinghuensis TaxID=1539050 RepID=A0A327VQQ9_9BACT|nr:SRPBCC domain-containing protein [Chitinophaga dinghuensis]RAJ77383.1 uncharacterized protein YndB with AHSA1/START domain [Chitinophaga dinghuensis]